MTEATPFLAQLHQSLDRYFSLEEIRTICFNLAVDYDNLPGEGKLAKARELILWLARQDRLPDLVNMAQQMRPNASWPSVPADFELPTSGPWSPTPQPTQNIQYGDTITVGDISGVQGLAIGRGANANVNIQQGIPAEQLVSLFGPLLQQVRQAPSEQRQTAVEKVNKLKEETAKGETADDEAVAGLVQDIVEIVPSAVEAIANLFTNAIIAKSAGAATKFVLSRLRNRK